MLTSLIKQGECLSLSNQLDAYEYDSEHHELDILIRQDASLRLAGRSLLGMFTKPKMLTLNSK